MAVIEIAKILVRRGQELQTGIPQLDPGEFGWAQDTEHLYIGKRIAEGAADDENTRILTERDLENVFALIGSAYTTATLNSVYKYRSDVALLQHTTTSTLQVKLDNFNPSITDFGYNPNSAEYTDITDVLKNAVADLFANPGTTWDAEAQRDLRRTLLIPEGLFIVSDTVELPPYAKIVGAGPGLTKITYTNASASLFKTVDADGNDFETLDMRSGVKRARDVHIEGMTLGFDNTLVTATSLLSLDNVLNARVENVVFRTEFDETSVTTYGLVDHGIGVEIRGSGDVGSELCQNVTIDNCRFDGLLTAVRGTGTVVHPIVNNSVFSNLNQGIVLKSEDMLQGPSNGYFSYNSFEDILNEAIYVGENPNNLRGNHLSTQNRFARVGSNVFNEFTTTSATSVISFMSPGNKSVDDYFARRDYAERNTDPTFYYNPLISGTVTIKDSATYKKEILSGSLNAVVLYVPLNGSDQLVTVTYQMSNPILSRKGVITMNIAPDGYVSLTDTYSYNAYPGADPDEPTFNYSLDNIPNNYVSLTISSAQAVTIDYQLDIQT